MRAFTFAMITSRNASLACLACVPCVACVACVSCIEQAAERIPVVDAPVCQLHDDEPAAAPGITMRVPLAPAAGCNSSSVTSQDLWLQARRGDGSLDDNNFYVEERVTAFQVGDVCEIHVDTTAWERKLDDLLPLDPIAAQVTLCGARVTTAYADALSSAAPELALLRVGFDPDDAPPELTTLVGTPQPMPVEDDSVSLVCGDAGDVVTHVERYAFHHRVVVRMSKEDALRLAWDGALEIALDVLYE